MNLNSLYKETVTDTSKEKLQQFLKLLNKDEIKIFNYLEKFSGECNFKITNNSIKLCLKIYKETKLKVFPIIQKCIVLKMEHLLGA